MCGYFHRFAVVEINLIIFSVCFVQERFAEIFGKDAAAESRKSQESFKKWLLAGMTLLTGVVVGSLIAQKRLWGSELLKIQIHLLLHLDLQLKWRNFKNTCFGFICFPFIAKKCHVYIPRPTVYCWLSGVHLWCHITWPRLHEGALVLADSERAKPRILTPCSTKWEKWLKQSKEKSFKSCFFVCTFFFFFFFHLYH